MFRYGFDMERDCILEKSKAVDMMQGVKEISDKVTDKEIEREKGEMTMIARWEYGIWIIWAPP